MYGFSCLHEECTVLVCLTFDLIRILFNSIVTCKVYVYNSIYFQQCKVQFGKVCFLLCVKVIIFLYAIYYGAVYRVMHSLAFSTDKCFSISVH